jgi:hypothetical protein
VADAAPEGRVNAARATWTLLGALAVAVLADVAVHVDRGAAEAELPSIPNVDLSKVTRIDLEKGDTIVTLEKDGAVWQVTAPYRFPADEAQVLGILKPLAEGVPMDLRVDSGNGKEYGLESPDVVRVEISGAAGSLASFYVGNNAAGGSSFVRFPGSEDVYRARLGGKHRYDKPPGEWRDHRVVTFNPELVDRLVIERREGSGVALVREIAAMGDGSADAPKAGPWRTVAEASFPVDQKTADEALAALSKLRAGEILAPDHPSGTDDPEATVTVHLVTDETLTLLFGRTADGAFVRKQDASEVYRIAPSALDRIAQPRGGWRDRSFLQFDATAVQKVQLIEPTVTTSIERQAEGVWRVTEPKNVDVDSRDLGGAMGLLDDLRADELADVAPAQAGFPSKTRVIVTLADGRAVTLEIGNLVPNRPQGQEAHYVRVPEQPARIGVLSLAAVSRIRKGFGR